MQKLSTWFRSRRPLAVRLLPALLAIGLPVSVLADGPADAAAQKATVERLIEIGQDWRVWVLCDREPTEDWIDGRAVLLGDAAHPTLQYYAQGACMALEDAVCLSERISNYPDDLDKALTTYRDNRVVRTARIQIGSRQLGDNWFHVDGVQRKLRNEIMGTMTAEDYYYQLNWLYGHNEAKRAA